MDTCPICRWRATKCGAETCGHPNCVAAVLWQSLAELSRKPRQRARAEAHAIKQTMAAHAVALVERRRVS